MATETLDDIVRSALSSFYVDLCNPKWHGRERDAVNLFVFGHLVHSCKKGTPLFDSAQLGVEMPVPQIPNKKSKGKKYVCKDVVIWSQPKATVGNTHRGERNYPLAVLEWKSLNRKDGPKQVERKLKEHEFDIDWLQQTAKLGPGFQGYAVLIGLNADTPSLRCVLITNGRTERHWLVRGMKAATVSV